MKRTSDAIQVCSTSTIIPCSMRGITVEAIHDPTIKECVIPKIVVEKFIGNMPLVAPADRLFKTVCYGFLPCQGIARDITIIIDKIEVHLDFYIFDIMEDFDVLLGFPLEKLLQQKSSQGSLDDEFGKTTSTTPISCPESLEA